MDQFVKQFDKGTLPLEMWDHYGRLQIVYYSVVKFGLPPTMQLNSWLCTKWKSYKESIGHGHLWNYTLTMFWAQIIAKLAPKYNNFNELYADNTWIHNGNLYRSYYSDEIIFSSAAKNNWVKPDLKAL